MFLEGLKTGRRDLSHLRCPPHRSAEEKAEPQPLGRQAYPRQYLGAEVGGLLHRPGAPGTAGVDVQTRSGAHSALPGFPCSAGWARLQNCGLGVRGP